MRNPLLLLLLILLLNPCQALVSFALPQTRAEQATVEEVEEARKVVAEFMRRMQQTRDLATLKDLYINDFISHNLKSYGSSLPDVGSSPSFSRDLATQLSHSDWERYYFAQVNLRYFMVLYLASTHSPEQINTMEKGEMADANLLCPPEVFAVLDTSPFLVLDYRANKPTADGEVETPEEFHSLVNVLEKAGLMIRERFKRNPPEQSKWYRENLGDWTPSYLKQEETKPYLTIDAQERYGFPPGTHFFQVVTKPSLFELTLVKTDREIKIIWARVYPFN